MEAILIGESEVSDSFSPGDEEWRLIALNGLGSQGCEDFYPTRLWSGIAEGVLNLTSNSSFYLCGKASE
jgi:hypothetical protein